MKKRRAQLFAILLALAITFCGCGKQTIPYLSESERSAIEQSVLDTVNIYVFPGDTLFLGVSYTNNSNYDLADCRVILPEGHSLSYPMIPKGTEVEDSIYVIQTDGYPVGREIEVFLSYTIGAYTYRSQPKAVVVGEVPLPEIMISSSSGEVLLAGNGITDLSGENTPDGIEKSTIESISMSCYSGRGGLFRVSLLCKGTIAGSVFYKLYDSDGVVIDFGRVEKSYSGDSLEFRGQEFGTIEIKRGQYRLQLHEYA